MSSKLFDEENRYKVNYLLAGGGIGFAVGYFLGYPFVLSSLGIFLAMVVISAKVEENHF